MHCIVGAPKYRASQTRPTVYACVWGQSGLLQICVEEGMKGHTELSCPELVFWSYTVADNVRQHTSEPSWLHVHVCMCVCEREHTRTAASSVPSHWVRVG